MQVNQDQRYKPEGWDLFGCKTLGCEATEQGTRLSANTAVVCALLCIGEIDFRCGMGDFISSLAAPNTQRPTEYYMYMMMGGLSRGR